MLDSKVLNGCKQNDEVLSLLTCLALHNLLGSLGDMTNLWIQGVHVWRGAG